MKTQPASLRGKKEKVLDLHLISFGCYNSFNSWQRRAQQRECRKSIKSWLCWLYSQTKKKLFGFPYLLAVSIFSLFIPVAKKKKNNPPKYLPCWPTALLHLFCRAVKRHQIDPRLPPLRNCVAWEAADSSHGQLGYWARCLRTWRERLL